MILALSMLFFTIIVFTFVCLHLSAKLDDATGRIALL